MNTARRARRVLRARAAGTCSSSSTRRTSSTSTARTIPDAVAEYVKRGRNVVVLRTFSKIYGLAGLRVGYAVGPRDVCAAMAKVRRPFDVSDDRAGRGAREPRRRRRDRAPPRAQRRRAARASARTLRGSTGSTPAPGAVGNFVYVELGEDAAPLYERAAARGRDRPAAARLRRADAIRVSVGTPEEHALLAAALGRVLARA